MRKVCFVSALASLLFLVAFTATAGQSADIGAQCGARSGKLPPGAVIQAADDGSMTVDAVGDWEFFAEHEGTWSREKRIKVTCTCESGGGGCNPTYIQGSVMCVMSTCSTCTSSGARFVAFDGTNDSISFATSDDIKKLRPANNLLLSVPEVSAALDQFKIDNGAVSDAKGKADSYRYVPINVYGHLAALVVPADSKAALLPNAKRKANITCGCESGGGGCSKESSWGVTWCEAGGCSSCSMTVD
ncbi:MAG: hypothetical protein R3F22_07060 [Lysobacteraceae bacterium]